jgi:DNA-binding NtrC family response regulator
MRRILIVDDDAAVTNYLMVFLMQTELFEPVVMNDSREVPALLAKDPPDLMILDMDMPGLSGLDILRQVRDSGRSIPVVILTGVSDVDLAVRAMKLGAFDYITKPADDEKLLETIDRALEHEDLSRTLHQLPDALSREGLAHAAAFEHFVTADPGMIRLFHLAERMAAGDYSLFVQGERGTGKEALARAIHASSPRREGPFIAVDAAAIDRDRQPSELFGQVRDYRGDKEDRAGFLERAAGGTLFLNSIECLGLPVQVRLRRVIQDEEYYRESSAEIRKIDVRLIVSSTCDLAADEYREVFSRDLLYHLMVNSLVIPPLREHPGDIPLLAGHFLALEAERTGRRARELSKEFLDLLLSYDFPGNVGELEAVVSASVVNSDGETVTPDALPPFIRDRIAASTGSVTAGFRPRTMDEVRRDHLRSMLEYFGGDRKLAAEAAGVPVEEMDAV